MYAPRAFIGMTVALVIFAAAAYWMSGSGMVAFLSTIACAVLLQAGYFICLLYLVRRERQECYRPAQAGPGPAGSETLTPDAEQHLKITDR